MKIMFCLGSMTKGGAERVIANLSNEFCKKDNISIVVTPPDEPEYLLDKRINFITIDQKKDRKFGIIFRTLKRIKRLRKIIKHENPDIIVSLLPEPTYRMMIAKIGLHKKTIISVRNDPNVEYNTFLKKILVKILYSKADGFIFQTPDAQKWFSKKIQKKSVVIPNPINENFICKPYDGKRKKNIVTVGRLEKQKNHKMLIESFSKLSKKFNNYKLVIYGDGSLKDELSNYIKEKKLSKRVILAGQKDDIKSEIYDAALFVLSSDYEGMPNALMEALALGLPCISTDCPCGGPKYLIEDGINGYLVDVKNSDMLTIKMEYVLKNNTKKIEKNANRICDKLNPIKINKIWKKFIEEVYYNDL